MQVWCVGAGSIGLLYAAKLALAGTAVTVVTHSREQADRIAAEGVLFRERGADYRSPLASIGFDSLKQLMESGGSTLPPTPDWILLTVKQSHLSEELMAVVGAWSRLGARVIGFQNGIGHVEKLLAHVPARQLDIAVTTEGAHKITSNEVRHTGFGITRIGSAAAEQMTDKDLADVDLEQKKLAIALDQAGFAVSLSNNMKEIAWNKLLMNAVINPLTALLRIPNGQLLTIEPLKPLMRSLYEEAVEVALAQGIAIQEDLWEQLLEVCRRTANNDSSMLQDILAGRTTEMEWLNGSLLKVASEYAIPMAAHETVYRLIKALELRESQ